MVAESQRDLKLKPEFGHLYPGMPADTWMPLRSLRARRDDAEIKDLKQKFPELVAGVEPPPFRPAHFRFRIMYFTDGERRYPYDEFVQDLTAVNPMAQGTEATAGAVDAVRAHFDSLDLDMEARTFRLLRFARAAGFLTLQGISGEYDEFVMRTPDGQAAASGEPFIRAVHRWFVSHGLAEEPTHDDIVAGARYFRDGEEIEETNSGDGEVE